MEKSCGRKPHQESHVSSKNKKGTKSPTNIPFLFFFLPHFFVLLPLSLPKKPTSLSIQNDYPFSRKAMFFFSLATRKKKRMLQKKKSCTHFAHCLFSLSFSPTQKKDSSSFFSFPCNLRFLLWFLRHDSCSDSNLICKFFLSSLFPS